MAYQREGLQKASDMMLKDFSMISELNLERDEQATAGLGIELRLPFCDWGLVRYVLSLPARLKIGGVEESLQKLVLRRAAQLQGILCDYLPQQNSERTRSEKHRKPTAYVTGRTS
jgi:asparagine synthetase B (glutamine-hydrolysing)